MNGSSQSTYLIGPCRYVYDPEKDDPDIGIAPGTPFEALLDDWCCPVCGVSKDMFELDSKTGVTMLKNNIEIDVKVKCIESTISQAKLASAVGTSPFYVNRLIKKSVRIVNNTFVHMMEHLGYDVEISYVKRDR